MMNRELFLAELKNFWIKNDVPNISKINASFIRDLIKIQKTENMLEIGTANWYSTINFAIELEKTNWHIFSIEFSPHSYEEAQKNINNVWLENTITLIQWNALDEIWKFEDIFFDFVFIDWMKKRSKDFLELSWPKLKNNWILIIDDVIKFKDKMSSLWTYLDENNFKYNIIPIDIDDWVLMIIKD